jgi:hypothetical protein
MPDTVRVHDGRSRRRRTRGADRGRSHLQLEPNLAPSANQRQQKEHTLTWIWYGAFEAHTRLLCVHWHVRK